jgi:hypothetical protein
LLILPRRPLAARRCGQVTGNVRPHHCIRMLTRLARLIAVLLALAAFTPWILYEVALSLVSGRPQAPKLEPSATEVAEVWKEFKGTGVPKVEPLNPISYFKGFSEPERTHASSRLAWSVARVHNAERMRVKGNLWWHLSVAAVTIWLTRNWSIEQLVAKAAEHRTKSAA